MSPLLKKCSEHKVHYLYNSALLPKGPADVFAEDTASASLNRLGRGTAWLVQVAGLNAVWRHCQRGGAFRHLVKDSYIFTGLGRTRMWREAHLLMMLYGRGLPVPLPVAARCVRRGLLYRGDLVTQQIPNARTLVEWLQDEPLSEAVWQSIGHTIAEFHRQGVYHADLNANNIMMDNQKKVFLIDFDKAEFRPMGQGWTKANLDRLARSFRKQRARVSPFHYSEEAWQWLLQGYQKRP